MTDDALFPSEKPAPSVDAIRVVPSAVPLAPHRVLFYRTDTELISELTAYVGGALAGNGHALVVATADHTAALRSTLPALDLAVATIEGRAAFFSAEDTLASFMRDGTPVAELFEESVGGIVAAHLAFGGALHAYGEMVALLWKDGNVVAALQLEELWNDLQLRLSFELLCAYPLGDVAPQQGDGFASICHTHSDMHLSSELAPGGDAHPVEVRQAKPAGPAATVRHLRSARSSASSPSSASCVSSVSFWAADTVALIDCSVGGTGAGSSRALPADGVALQGHSTYSLADEAQRASVLRLFATCLRRHLRAPDLAYRMQGSGFLVIMPGTAPDQAMLVLEFVRLNCEREMPMAVSFCAGIAATTTPGDFTTAVQRADNALARARLHGPGRSEVAVSMLRHDVDHTSPPMLVSVRGDAAVGLPS